MSSSDDSISDFDMDAGDTGEGVEIKVQSSMHQSIFKTQAILEEQESEPDLGIDEDQMEDWEDDSQAPSIYKKALSEKSLLSKPPLSKRQKYFHLFDEKPKKRSKNFDVKERFYKHQDRVKEKIEKLTEIVKEQEIEECTFRPTILNKNKKNRTVDEFLATMQKFEDNKKDKIKVKLQEQEMEIKKLKKIAKPKLCKNSRRMVDMMEVRDLEKLAKAKGVVEGKDKAKEEVGLFRPNVCARSKEMFRGKKVEDILYDDAVRRASRVSASTPTIKGKYASSNSEKVLLEKFKREFEEHFSYLDIEGNQVINYTKFTTLLYNMNFLSRSSSKISKQKQQALKIWTLIGGEECNTVHFSNLLAILTCIMNYKDPSIPSHNNPPSLGYLINSAYHVCPSEIPKLHQYFFLLFEEKTLSKPKSPETSISDSISEQRKKSDTHYEDKLILEKTRLQEKWETIRQQKLAEEVSECTFQPQITRGPRTIASSSDLNDSTLSQYSFFSETKSNVQRRNDILYEYSKLFTQQRHNTSKIQIDNENLNEVKSCTFKPKIKNKPKFDEVPEAKGVKDMISRLRKARKVKKPDSSEKPFLFGLEPKTKRISVDLNSSVSSISSVKSEINKSFSSDIDQINVMVNMPNGKKSLIRFNSGENKNKVLNRFIKSGSFTGEIGGKAKSQLKELFS